MSRSQSGKKIAVVGSGIAGVSAAYYLGKKHSITLYESRERLGGHTHTVVVEEKNGAKVPVDTGFIVCNDRTYPNFHRFIQELEVPVRKADMSFGFYDENTGFGYAPTGLGGLVPKISHLWNRAYLSLWRSLPGFNSQALADLQNGKLEGLTLREYVAKRRVSKELVDLFIVPMGAAIWSSADERLLDTPAQTFFAFFKNHGLLTLFDRPQWQTVIGGSHQYLKAFKKQFTGEILLGSGVEAITREGAGVSIKSADGQTRSYDAVVIACHADQVLPLLSDPSEREKELYSVWKYHSNKTILHTDKSYLPPSKKIWASWNYRREKGEEGHQPLSVTYHMNRLQGLVSDEEYCVTLNPRREIPSEYVIRDLQYYHPMFSEESVATQKQIQELSGERHTYYCGSYLGWGFHEDAIKSSVELVARVEATLSVKPQSVFVEQHAAQP